MEIDPEEIAGKRFGYALRGYDRRQVATYLGEVAASQRELIAAREAAQAAAVRNAASERIANERLAALEREAHRQAEREADLNAELAAERQAELAEELGLELPAAAAPAADLADELAELEPPSPDEQLPAPDATTVEQVGADTTPAAPASEPTPEPAPAGSTATERTASATDEVSATFTRELAELVRATHERVATIEAAAAADAATSRAAAAQALADAESRAAAMLQDALRRVDDLGREAEDDARRRADALVTAAQERVDHLRGVESQLRQRIDTAHAELTDALAALDPPDTVDAVPVDQPTGGAAPLDGPVIDLATPNGSVAGGPSTLIDLSSTPQPTAPPPTTPPITWTGEVSSAPGTTATATATRRAPVTTATTVGEVDLRTGAPEPEIAAAQAEGEDDDDVGFDRLVRDALDRAVRQTRPQPGA